MNAITVVFREKRLLTRSEAASYMNLPETGFEDVCPVPPVDIHPRRKLWDKRDLDEWIDRMKRGKVALTVTDAIEGLRS